MTDSTIYKKVLDEIHSSDLGLVVSKDYSSESIDYLNNKARTLNYYKEEGLLHERAKKSNFSFVELVWVRMIYTLREIGVNTDLIKKLKQALFALMNKETLYEAYKESEINLHAYLKNLPKEDVESIKEQIDHAFKKDLYLTQIQFSKLYTLIAYSIIKKVPIEIRIFADGNIAYFSKDMGKLKELELEERPELVLPFTNTYISISLTEIITYHLGTNYLNTALREIFFTEDELLIFETIRKEKPKTITIDFDNDNSIDLIKVTGTKKIDINQRLTELILNKGYEEITIITDKGNIVKCIRTKKIRPKKKTR